MAGSRCGPETTTREENFRSRGHQSAETFETLAVPCLGSLYNFACWLVHNRHDAEDLVQETYLKALRGFTSFQPGTNFRAWMFRILKNTLSSARAKPATRMTVAMESEGELALLAEDCRTPESWLIARSGIKAVQVAIEQLPDIYREVLLLCDTEDASYREIAEILSIPIGTVMSRLARARKFVRQSLHTQPDAGRYESSETVLLTSGTSRLS